MGFRRRKDDPPKVDLTPMIDVVFLLLIFFMISTTFIERPGLNIDLPVSNTQQVKQNKEEIQVYLAENGDIYLQREKTNLVDLHGRLLSLGPDITGKMTFLLMADKSARHGKVVQLMDIAKTAGFGQLAIATDKATDEEITDENFEEK